MSAGPKIPKTLGKAWLTLNDPLSFPMTFLTIDVERSFLRFLELGVRFGHVTKPINEIETRDYDELFLENLSKDERIYGLDQAKRKLVLDGWLRAVALKFESRGLDRSGGRRIAMPRPLHLGVIRSGLPSRYPYLIHHSDVWVYYSTLLVLEKSGVPQARRFVGELLRKRLGLGMELDRDQFHHDEPKYDEKTPVDVNVLVTLRMLSKFTSARPDDVLGDEKESWPSRPWVNSWRKYAKKPSGMPGFSVFKDDQTLNSIEKLVVCPNAFENLGVDLVQLLCCYDDLEGSELTQHCLALISLRLYRAPLIAANEIRALLESRDKLVISEQNFDTGEIYCDFSDSTDTASTHLARRCVARDLEVHRIFLRDRFYLRVLEWIGQLQDKGVQEKLAAARTRSVREYFQALVELSKSESMQMAARQKLQEFDVAVSPEDETNESNSRWRELLVEWRASDMDEITQLTQILLSSRSPGGRAPAQIEQWCWTTGGMYDTLPHRPYALLAGSVKHRSTWRYAPTDHFLKAILLGSFATGKPGTSSAVSEMRFAELLDVIENRYGIVIARPPIDMIDADTLRTAERNRAHFARKLQLLGCFDGLSDDSHYQMVRRPR